MLLHLPCVSSLPYSITPGSRTKPRFISAMDILSFGTRDAERVMSGRSLFDATGYGSVSPGLASKPRNERWRACSARMGGLWRPARGSAGPHFFSNSAILNRFRNWHCCKLPSSGQEGHAKGASRPPQPQVGVAPLVAQLQRGCATYLIITF